MLMVHLFVISYRQNHIKMKGVACIVLAFVAIALSQEAKDKDGERPTVFQRLIPADVLRGINQSTWVHQTSSNYSTSKYYFHVLHRFPWNLFCFHKMCYLRAWCILGLEAILRKVYLRCPTGKLASKLSNTCIFNVYYNIKILNWQGRLWELVEDCGPLPKPNPKCKLSEKTNKTADFPGCCPLFECEAGVQLEYPEVPSAPNAGPGSSSAAAPAGTQAVSPAKQ